MGRNKMENDFKDKLNQREVQPSAEAWDRLNAMLTVAEGKKPKRGYSWLHIAAGLLGFLFVGTVFLMQSEEMTDVRRNDIVFENKLPVKPSKKVPAINETNVDAVSPTETIASATEKKSLPNPTNNSKAILESGAINSNSENQKYIAESPINQNNNQSPIINQKSEQQTATIDELLATVQSTENAAPQSIKVNANSLLSQVDGELELSFREKVIKNFKTAKVALANRNIKE